MRYASGKTRISEQIMNAILTHTFESNLTLVSLFCGALSVETKLAPHFDSIICNDLQPYLIELYKSMQSGWLPPDSVSLDDYYYVKNEEYHDEKN